MKEQEVRSNKTVFKWALITSVVLIALVYVFLALKIDEKSPLNYLSYVPFFIGLAIAVRTHRDHELDGYISFGRAFSTGFRFSSLLSIFMGIFMLIFFKWLSPEVLQQGLNEAEQQMLDQGKTAGEIENALLSARNYGPYFAALGTSIMYTLIGGAGSFILALILKREKPIYIVGEE